MLGDAAVSFVGRLGGDPEMRFLPAGAAVASFSVAVQARRKNADGEWEDGATSWYNCTLWRDQAEHVIASLRSGDRVMVSGTIRQREWETKEGDKRRAYDVDVDEVGPTLRFVDVLVKRPARERDLAGAGAQAGRASASSSADPPPF